MSFNDEINVLKDGGCVLCACCCSECTVVGGPCFALSSKVCCCSLGIGFKAAAAAAAGAITADFAGVKSRGGKAAAALAAAGAMDMVDDNSMDFNCGESPCDNDRGCCEIVLKLCLCYYELQFPPGQDIGCGCCGIRMCDNNDHDHDSDMESDAPDQEVMG